MRSLLSGLFDSNSVASRPAGRRGPRRRSRGIAVHEQLEQRLAMAVDVFRPVAASQGVASFSDWFVVTSDDADSVYMKQVSTVPQDLYIADNASFNDARTLGAFHADGSLWNGIGQFKTMYVTNGTRTNATVAPTEFFNGTLSTFALATKVADKDAATPGVIGAVIGTVSYAGNSWSFTNGGSGSSLSFSPLLPSGSLSDPNLIKPVDGSVSTVSGGATADGSTIFISWSAPALPAAGVAGPRITTVTYDTSATTPTTPATTATETFLERSAGSNPGMALPVTQRNPGGIIPGTLSGSLTVDGFTIGFRINTVAQTVSPIVSTTGRRLSYPLLFANGSVDGTVDINRGTKFQKSVNVTADVDHDRGTVSLEFREGTKLIDPGAVSLSADYAVYDQNDVASSVTFAPGLGIQQQVYTDLLTPGSTVNVNSPILQSLGSEGQIDLRATNVNINAQLQAKTYLDLRGSRVDRDPIVRTAAANAIVSPAGKITAIAVPAGRGGQGYDKAPVVTITGGGSTSNAVAQAILADGVVVGFKITDPGSGYTSLPTVSIAAPATLATPGTPTLESVAINAAVAAPNVDIRVADDPNTPETIRGRLFVSATASIAGALDNANSAISSLYVQGDKADVVVEGTINATTQTYLLRSPVADQSLAPFLLTTVSPSSGANTGLIAGDTVAITLGNDVDTPDVGSVAFNKTDLRTSIRSLRVTAATRNGAPLNGPFPYELTIAEEDDISVDAVAASSRPLSLSAGGSIAFTAALATAGDLSITAGKSFTQSAPLSTARGQVQITGGDLTVSNSIRVLDPVDPERIDDIVLTATAGDISLTGAVSAANYVRLVQRNRAGATGKISGPARIVARGLAVEADGSADLLSDVVSFEGQFGGDFTLDELNDITVTSLRSPGFVTLRAGGFDPGADNPATPNPIALTASLQDVTRLEATAPRGSISIVTDTTKGLLLGNPATIGSGKASSMQAAGSVEIRSTASAVTVADAPLGGGSAVAVRVATTANLNATFAFNTPGIFPSTLTNSGARGPLTIDGIALRAGDRVLVKNQSAGRERENGIYVVTTVGNATTDWRLTRATDADTTAEVPANTFVQVAEGTSGGKVFTIRFTPTENVSPMAVTSVANRGDAVRVRVATTLALAGVYDSTQARITASANGFLPAIDGVSLAVDDVVLVRAGAVTGGAAANGVYKVTSIGGGGAKWTLDRAIDPDSGSPIALGLVVTNEGSFRAAATGQAFRVSYDTLGNVPMIVDLVGSGGRPTTDIGTDDLNDSTTFVVSSTAGSNSAAGSLGKMISLRGSLDSSSALNPTPKVDFGFATSLPGLAGGAAGTIRLTEELPAISKAFAINGANRVRLPGGPTSAATGIAIDGSRIVTTRTGQPAVTASEVNGIEFVSGAQSAVGQAGGSVSNMTIGGFAKGAAVKINGVGGILVDKMTLGRSETGDRLSNKFGVLVSGPLAEGTVAGSTIVGSTGAGIRTEANAVGLAVVGSTVGLADQGNLTGIELTTGASRVGLNPVTATTSPIRTNRDSKLLTLPSTIVPQSLHLGQSVSGPGIAPGTTVAAINGSNVTLSKEMTTTAVTNGVRFASPARNTVQYNQNGLALSGGVNTVTNTNIGNNVSSGIKVTGGNQVIGTTQKTGSVSNAIFANGRYGVEGGTAGYSVTIQGNNFGIQGRNKLGNVDPTVPNSRLYVPSTKTRVDLNGNFHAIETIATGPRRRTSR
jgi:hypothetical protein